MKIGDLTVLPTRKLNSSIADGIQVGCCCGSITRIAIKILFVDDERDVEALFRQKFRKEIKNGELEFSFSFSGEEALKLLGSDNPPKFIYVFSDKNMPGTSGLELLDEIKERYSMVQVSMISAHGDTDKYNKAIKSCAKCFFTKPVDFESLKYEIREMANPSI